MPAITSSPMLHPVAISVAHATNERDPVASPAVRRPSIRTHTNVPAARTRPVKPFAAAYLIAADRSPDSAASCGPQVPQSC